MLNQNSHQLPPLPSHDDFDTILNPPSRPIAFSNNNNRLKLSKQQSWSNESGREEAWIRRKDQWKLRKSKSLTDEDLDELRGCIDLGFGFSNKPDKHLVNTLPALDLYYAVNRQLAGHDANKMKSKLPSAVTTPPSEKEKEKEQSECSFSSIPEMESFDENREEENEEEEEEEEEESGSSWLISSPGDTPQLIKTRLRHWAQVVACSIRQSC